LISKILIFSFTFFVFCSCERVKKTGEELVEISKSEISEVSKKVWDKTVEFTFEGFSYTDQITLKDIYPNENIPEFELIQSIKINTPINFYSCYFKYRADKKETLKFLSDLKTSLPDISDSTYEVTNGKEIEKNLESVKLRAPELEEEISFFFEINSIENIEYFRCNKYPNANYLAIDVKNGIIYHLIEYYWD